MKKDNFELKNEEKYIEEEIKKQSTSDFEVTKKEFKMYVNSPRGLNVRYIASIEGERIAVLEDQAEVIILEENTNDVIIDRIKGKWFYIKSGEIAGWVFGGYLSNKKRRTQEEIFVSMEDAIYYIFFEQFPFSAGKGVRYYNNIKEFSNDYPNYIICEGIPQMSIHGGYYTEHLVSGDGYSIMVWERGDDFLFSPTGFIINEENYLYLFPYNTIDKFIESESWSGSFNVNIYNENTNDRIEYDHGENKYALNFENGYLNSITIKWYIP
jgi:hypothetical protein